MSRRGRGKGFTDKPSDRLQVKTANPFAPKNKSKTNFGYVYQAGGVPCRIQHGSCSMRLQWDMPVEQIPYDPLLINCFEGLLETEHPFAFVARQGLMELLQADGSADKIIPLLQRAIMPLRLALMNANRGVFESALQALHILSEVVGPYLNPYLLQVLQPLGKKLNDRALREKVLDVLQIIEEQGGEEAFHLIKSKIPTYRT